MLPLNGPRYTLTAVTLITSPLMIGPSLSGGTIGWAWIWPDAFTPWEGLVLVGLFAVDMVVLAWRGKPYK